MAGFATVRKSVCKMRKSKVLPIGYWRPKNKICHLFDEKG